MKKLENGTANSLINAKVLALTTGRTNAIHLFYYAIKKVILTSN